MSTIRWLFLICVAMVTRQSVAQVTTDSLFVMPDSVKPFTIELFYRLILDNHPVARQAALLSDMARQEVRLARGNFDPKIELQYLTKNFDDTEYYSILNGSLKFPSVFPLDPVVGVERNSGAYLNPERYISDAYDYRQFYAGVSLPLGRGLLTDDRRTALRQADLFGELMEAEQISMLNKLLLNAASDYWRWSFAYYNYRLFDRNVAIASEIFRRVKLNNELGEASDLDTVQAKITLQQRLVERQEALLDFRNTGVVISNYLWDSLRNPLQLSADYVPVLQRSIVGITDAELESLLAQARSNHPDLQKLGVKLRQLEVDRRLAAENLKPRLNLDYYFLNQPFNPEWGAGFDPGENYKFGLDFSFPIFIRKERAKLSQAKIKITSTQLERSFAEREIVNAVQVAYQSLVTGGALIRQQTEMVEGYDRLLSGELINFENGESDLFRINVQQQRLIESQTKLIKLLSDYEKQKAYLYWSAGSRRLAGYYE